MKRIYATVYAHTLSETYEKYGFREIFRTMDLGPEGNADFAVYCAVGDMFGNGATEDAKSHIAEDTGPLGHVQPGVRSMSAYGKVLNADGEHVGFWEAFTSFTEEPTLEHVQERLARFA